MLGVEPEAAAHRGRGPRRRLAAGEVSVREVEHPGGGERAEPLGPPPLGERAGAYGLLQREAAEDGVEEIVGEAAQPVLLHGSAVARLARVVRFHVTVGRRGVEMSNVLGPCLGLVQFAKFFAFGYCSIFVFI